MRNADQPHGYQPTPDGDCFICGRIEDATVHSDEAHAKVISLTPRGTATRWADMTGPQRFVTAVFLAGMAMVFGCLVLALCIQILQEALT